MFELIIPLEELQVRSRSPLFVAGRIWAKINGVDFPGAHWTDSPISVLGSLEAAIHAVRRREVSDVYFFDGPYYLKFFPEGMPGDTSMMIDMAAVCDRQSDEGIVLARASVELPEIIAQYQLSISSLFAWAERHGESDLLNVLEQMSSFVEH